MATPDELHRSNTGGSTDASRGAAGDDHAGPTGADPTAVRAGHEPDQVSVRGILVVPGIILVGFVIAYVTVTILIKVFKQPDVAAERSANQLALKQAQAPINDRIKRINDPRSEGGDDQPRLEGVKAYNYGPDDPAYVRSRLPAPKGNSPEIHPEDVRPENVPYLWDATAAYGWVENGKVAHIPIERAIEIAAKNKNVLPIQADPIPVEALTGPGRPKQTNSGRGIPGQPGFGLAAREAATNEPKGKEQPKAEGKQESKKDEGKAEGRKDEPKKDESKKDAPKNDSKEKGPEPKEKGGPEGKK